MTVCLCIVMVLFVGTVTQLSGTISVNIFKNKNVPQHNGPMAGMGHLPLSKVKGSLATSTISAPLSLLSILYCPGPSPCIQLVPDEKYKDAASSVVLLTYFVHTTL